MFKIKTYIKILFFVLITMMVSPGCAAKKDYNKRRGLMLLESHEYPRNKKVYKPSKTIRKLKKNK